MKYYCKYACCDLTVFTVNEKRTLLFDIESRIDVEFPWSKGQPQPQLGSLGVLIQLTVWVSPRGAGRKTEQSVIRPPSPRDMAAVGTHEAVRETNKGWTQMPPVWGGSPVQPSSQVKRGAAGENKKAPTLKIGRGLTWISDSLATLRCRGWCGRPLWHHWWPWCRPPWYPAAPQTWEGHDNIEG